MFSLRLNCSVMMELPSELVDVIWLSPGTWPNCRSSGAVTDDAITSGIGSGIKRHDLDRGIVDFRKRGDRKLRVGNQTHQKQPDHQQGRRDRAKNKNARRTHRPPEGVDGACVACPEGAGAGEDCSEV